MSDYNAETLNAVHLFALVEMEISPWSFEEETRRGNTKRFVAIFLVISPVRKLPTPLAGGLLKVESPEEIPEGDIHRNIEQFLPE